MRTKPLSGLRLGIFGKGGAGKNFGVLVHAGWSKKRALYFNVLSALSFLLGRIVTYAASFEIDVTFLLPLAAGNFIYIAASDVVPEVNKHPELARSILHFGCFVAGAAILYVLAALHGH